MNALPEIGFSPSELDGIRRSLGKVGLWQQLGENAIKQTAYCAAFHHAALRLFPKHHFVRLENGEIVYRLSNGNPLVILINDTPELTAKAQVIEDNISIAWVSSGLLRAIFELSAGFWTSSSFLPNVGASQGLEANKQRLGLPRGLEYVRQISEAKNASDIHFHAPGWLNIGLGALDSVRRYGFERSLMEAIRFLLLHEIAHVNLGHLALQQSLDGTDEISETGLEIIDDAYLSVEIAKVRRGMEIQADRVAINAVLQTAKQRSERQTLQSSADIYATLTGLLTTMIVFQSIGDLRRVPEQAQTHPPLWFRGFDIVENYRASKGATNDDLRQSDMLSKLLNSIISTHPIFGEWLGPIQDNSHVTFRDNLLAEARMAMVPHQSALRKHAQTIVERPESWGVIDLSRTGGYRKRTS